MTKIRMSALLMFLAVPLLAVPTTAQADDSAKHFREKVHGTYIFRMVPARSFSDVSGTSGLAAAPQQDILRVGVFKADAKGNITGGHTLATTDDNNGHTFLVDFTWAGSYTANPDGTGTLTISGPSIVISACTDETGPAPVPPATCIPFEGGETYSIVINSEKTVEMTQTDNVGGGAKIFMTGTATRRDDSNGSSN